MEIHGVCMCNNIAQGEKANASGVWLPGTSSKYEAGKVLRESRTILRITTECLHWLCHPMSNKNFNEREVAEYGKGQNNFGCAPFGVKPNIQQLLFRK